MRSRSKKVLVLGDVNLDITMPVEEYPVPGRDGIIQHIQIQVGGGGLNPVIVLSKLGLKTSISGCVGNDIWAEQVKEITRRYGIETTHLQICEETCTGLISIIVTPDGERTMLSYRGANAHLDINKINDDILDNVSVLHVSGYAFMDEKQFPASMKMVDLACNLGIPISIDSGLEPVLQQPEVFKKITPILYQYILGKQEAFKIFNTNSVETALEEMLSSGIKRAVIKLGSGGCYLAEGKTRHYIPEFQTKVVDTTGAGDAFSAGLVFGIINNFSLLEAGIFANSLGALATNVWGAGEHLPGINDFKIFLKNEKQVASKYLYWNELNNLNNRL